MTLISIFLYLLALVIVVYLTSLLIENGKASVYIENYDKEDLNREKELRDARIERDLEKKKWHESRVRRAFGDKAYKEMKSAKLKRAKRKSAGYKGRF